MAKKTFKLLLIPSLVLLLAGCNEYTRLYKSNDRDLMYHKAIEYYQQGNETGKKVNYTRAIQLFEEISPYYTGTEREDSVAYYSGAAYYKSGDFATSEIVFDDFRRRFGRSPFIEDVEYMYAMGFYFASPRPDRDQTPTYMALQAINEYLVRYPNSLKKEVCLARIDELNNKLYEKSYLNAYTYYKIERYKSAVVALRNSLAEYPDTPHREDILYMITKSGYELARNSIPSLQRDRYMDVMDFYYTFIAEYPESKYRKDADNMFAASRKFLEKNQSDITNTEDGN